MRKKMRMFLVIALTLCLVITMIPGLSYAAVKEETKDAEDVVTHEESHDAPLPDIIKVKLMNEDLTKEDQSDGHTTYSFGGNRKLMVFDVDAEDDHSDVIKVSKDHEPILQIGDLSELLSDKYIENARLYLYEDGEGKRLQFGAFCDEEKQLAAKTTSSGEKGHECVLTLTDLIRSHAEKGDIDQIVLRASDDKQKGSASFYGRDAKEAKYWPALAVTYYDGPAAPRARLSREYVKTSKELRANWTGLYATELTKVQYCITEKDSKADLQYSDLSGKYVKEKAKKVLIPETSDLPDGTYTLYLRGMDEQGRKGDVKELEFTVDGTAPSLSDISVKAESEKKQKTPTVRWSASDENFKSVTVTVDGRMIFDSTNGEDDSYTIPDGILRTEGEHEINLTVTDLAGNFTEQSVTYITTDGPIIENVIITPESSQDHPATVSTPSIEFDVWHNGARVQYTELELDGDVIKHWSGTGHKTFAVPEGILENSGEYTFQIISEDLAGDVTSVEVSYHLILGIPEIEELSVTPQTTASTPSKNRRPVIEWRVSESCFDRIEYKVGNGSWNTMGTTLTGNCMLPASALSNGANTIQVRGKNQQGYYSDISTLKYYLSTSAIRSDYAVTGLSVREHYGKAVLNWSTAAQSDAVKVSVHRGSTSGFTPSASTLVKDDVKGTMWTDPAYLTGTVYYRIVTTALSGSWAAQPLISSSVQYVSSLTADLPSSGTGSKDYLPTFDFTAPMGSGSIEESGGNLLYSQEDYSLSNDHFEYGLTRTYNSRDKRSGMLGRGWSDSYHKELYRSGNSAWLIDSDGTCYPFTKSGGTWSCAETKEHTLTEITGGYALEDKDHIVTTFNESGQMTEQREPNGCSLTYIYSRRGTLGSIISNTGLKDARILSLTYSQNDPYVLSEIALYDGSSMQYTVTSGKLTKASHRKGNDHIDWPYTYDTNGYMTSLKDGEQNTYSITYTGGKVSQITYPNQEKAQFSYGSGTTTVTGKTPDGDTLYTMSASYDSTTGKVLSETGKDGRTTDYTYSAAHPYLVATEKTTVYYETLSSGTVSFQSQQSVTETEFTYDTDENITSIETSDGEVTEYTYDSEERVIEESTTVGNTETDHTSYSYCDEDSDIDGTEIYNVKEEEETISGITTVYTYDDRGNEEVIITSGDGEYSETTTEYDTQGDPKNEAAVSGTGGNEVTQETETNYDAMGRVIKSTTGEITIKTEYDFMGRAVTETESVGNASPLVTTKTYDDNGALVSVTDPRGLTTTYSYDSMNRCVREHKAGTDDTVQDTYTEYGYDENVTTTDGRSTKTYAVVTKETVKNTAQETVSETYMDASGNVIKEVRSDQYTDHSYDGSGNQYATYTAGTSGNDHLLVLDLYDDQGRSVATIQNPTVSGNTYSTGTNSLVTKTTYNMEGEVATETDEDGIVTSYTYDDRQRITGVNVGSGNTTQTRTVSYSDTITEITDPGGKKTREVTNDSSLTIGMYDYSSGSVYTSGIAVTYTYDEKGRVLQETYRDGYSARYVYDAKDRVTEKKWYSGNTLSQRIVYTYNAFGDLASATCYTGSTETCKTTYTYDILGRKISESVSHSGGTAQTTGYSYDTEGNLASPTYPNSAQGISSLTYSYDIQNRLTEIDNGSSVMRTIAYDSLGRESAVTDSLSGTDSITTSYSYDSAGRLITSIAKNSSNTQIEKLTYTYSGTRITQRREQSSLPGITALDETRTYTYDALGRLINSTVGTSSAQYTYDAAGNQTSEDTGDMYRERYYNSLDQLSWESVSDYIWYEDQIIDYYYDGRGNMDSALDEEFNSGMIYDYHADGTMSQMHHRPGRDTGGWNLTQTMKYDHNGIRSEKTIGGQKTDYFYAEGKPIVFASASHTQTNIFNGEEIIGAYHGSTWYDYLTDQQGSTMGILKQDGTTAAAYSYSDFGETTARYGQTFNNEICYTGAVYDRDFGEYYLNARYYDPATANFLSQDTYRGDTGDYGQWNLYAYCANDPINCIDLSGHDAIVLKSYFLTRMIGHMAVLVQDSEGIWRYFTWDKRGYSAKDMGATANTKKYKSVKGKKVTTDINKRFKRSKKSKKYRKYLYIEGNFSGSYSYITRVKKGKSYKKYHLLTVNCAWMSIEVIKHGSISETDYNYLDGMQWGKDPRTDERFKKTIIPSAALNKIQEVFGGEINNVKKA